MVKKNVRRAAAVAVLGLAWLLSSGPAEAQKTKGKSRAAETKYLMRGLVQVNCADLSKALKNKPGDDKAWDALAQNAALLNEAGYLLLDDGRCPDKDWANAAKTLQACSAKVLDAAKAKDADAAQTAFKGLTASCADCHKVHKPKK